MTTSAHTIQLNGNYKREEALAGAAFTPGHLVEFYNASGTRKLRKHSTEGGPAEKMFAVEDALQGNTIDDAYALGDLASVNIAEPGSLVQAWLDVGETVVVGDKLVSGGNGTLIKKGSEATSVPEAKVLAVAEEALTLTFTGAAATRIDVRVL